MPDHPVIPFIEGDGTGRDIWKASRQVFDAAVTKSYGGKRKIEWLEIFAGEKAFKQFNNWLPDETVEAIRDFRVAIKGPLTTPVGGGIRSLNVTLRQVLDLYACVRPVRYFEGVPSPVKNPERMNVVIFRENTEDVYAGIEWRSGTPDAKRLIDFLNIEMLKGTTKQVRAGFRHRHQAHVALRHKAPGAPRHPACPGRKSPHRDPGPQGQHHEVHRRRLPRLGIRTRHPGISLRTSSPSARAGFSTIKTATPISPPEQIAEMIEPGLDQANEDFRKRVIAEVENTLQSISASHGNGQWKKKILINDRIADSVFQQVLTRADEYQVFATPNLNGDYLSDACAAQVGGLGMAPGANIGDGCGVFEATHGTAPKYADKDVINPSSVMLSGAMMFNFMGWREPATLIEDGIARTIQQKRVTYDLERLMPGAKKLKTSEYAAAIIENMQASSSASAAQRS